MNKLSRDIKCTCTIHVYTCSWRCHWNVQTSLISLLCWSNRWPCLNTSDAGHIQNDFRPTHPENTAHGGAAWRHHRRRSCSERMRQKLVNMYEPTVVLSRVYRTFDWPIGVPLVGDMKACLMRNYRYFDSMRVSVLCSVTSEWPSVLNKSFTASRSCVSKIYVTHSDWTGTEQ